MGRPRMAVNKASADQAGVDPEIFLALYEKMLHAYYVEEQCRVFVRAGKCSFYASARGHEKVQIAVSMLLQPGRDWFFPYYREKALMVGLGMPLKADQRDEIVYVSGGEGSTSEGEFFEAVNKAQHDRLPVLFVIQNNGYAISVPQEQQTHSQIYQVAAGFGMKSVRVDGTRFTEMYNTLKPLVQDLREGRGPLFVEAMVVRLDSHSSSDDQTKYRDAKNMEEARSKDPLAHTELRIREMGLLTDREVEEWRARIKTEVEEAARTIDALPYPDASTATADIYSPDRVVTQETEPGIVSEKPITMVEAINHGLREEMEANPKIVMWGEDIQDPKGGVFGVTRGLTEAFPGRVANSPL